MNTSYLKATKEPMVGYDMLECADLDEAIEVASKYRWPGAAPWNSGRSVKFHRHPDDDDR